MDNQELRFYNFLNSEIYMLNRLEFDIKEIYLLFLEIKFYKILGFKEEEVKQVINYLLDNSNLLNDELRNSLEVLIEQLEFFSHKQLNHIITNDTVKKVIYNYATDEIVYSAEQLKLKKQLTDFFISQVQKELIISAPTSFGKTKIILQEVEKYIGKKRIGILVPTKALINEYKSNLKNYDVSIHHFDFNKSNSSIFIGTPERMLLVDDKNFDILIIDEAYSVSNLNINDRDLLYVIAYKNINALKKVILVPYINLKTLTHAYKEVDIEFENPKFIEYNYSDSLVTYNNYFLTMKQNGNSTLKKRDQSEKQYVIKHMVSNEKDSTKRKLENYAFFLNELNSKFNLLSNTIIYYNSTNITSLILNLDYCDEEASNNPYVKGLIDYVKSQIHENYELVIALEKGFAIHNSKLDDFCKKMIEFLYRNKILKLLITTSTISQGVNLPCKNIIFTTSGSTIEAIDGKNTIARAGRFKEYNNGNRFYINLNQSGKLSPNVQKKINAIKSKRQIELKTKITIEDINVGGLIAGDKQFSSIFKEKHGITQNTSIVDSVDYFVGLDKKKLIESYVEQLSPSEIEYYHNANIDFSFLKKLFTDLEMKNNGNKITSFSGIHMATVYSKLIADISLKQMISESISKQNISINGSKLLWNDSREDQTPFNSNNFIHLNMLVRKLMETNQKIEFEASKIILYFYDKLESKTDGNLSLAKNMIELGTRDKRKIELFDLGIEYKYIQKEIIKLFGTNKFETKENILCKIEQEYGKENIIYIAVKEF